MAELKDIVLYILKEYPRKRELSNARVTKMVYLADWRHAINFGCQISNIIWYFDNYGPFVHDIEDVVKSHPEIFKIEDTQNDMGFRKRIFHLIDESEEPLLSPNEESSLKHIIQVTRDKRWDAFIKLVYSTHPISSSSRYSVLDLIAKAQDYNRPRDSGS